MTKKFFYAFIMVLGMLIVSPQTASAQFGLAGALSGALKKSNKKKEKEVKTVTISQADIIKEMSQFTMTNRETLPAIGQAYMDQMGAGKEFLAVNSGNWIYVRDDFGNIQYRWSRILVQYRKAEEGKNFVHRLCCSQVFNGVDYDEIRVFEDDAITDSYRVRIVE